MRHFCTYFDRNYLSRGLVLYDSLRAHHPSFRLYVGCFDEASFDYLRERALPGLVPMSIAALEAHDPELAAVRAGRTRVEYYFSSTASWLRFVLDQHPDVDLVTYLDADYCFYASAEPLFAEMSGGSIAAVEHRFPDRLRHLEDRGRFNVGWLSFRRDEPGLACLAWWRARCIEWCYDRMEDGKFADQKYLDEWPRLFPGLVVLRHKGVSVAPWNLARWRVRRVGGQLLVDDEPLVCVHFHGMKHVLGPLYSTGLLGYRVPLDATLRRDVFRPYLEALLRHEAELARAGVTSGRARSARYVGAGSLRERVDRVVNLGLLLASRTYLVAPLRRA